MSHRKRRENKSIIIEVPPRVSSASPRVSSASTGKVSLGSLSISTEINNPALREGTNRPRDLSGRQSLSPAAGDRCWKLKSCGAGNTVKQFCFCKVVQIQFPIN